MTLRRDGSGLLEGPIKQAVTWEIKGNELCIKMGVMIGTKCLTGVAVKSGFQTFHHRDAAFLFTR
ncbi:hypothetical protein [Mesorhizobium loti]|uniref:hypothetical protein n=1 Tax=Rhizobium loti TaxID=381 RepID=UPI000418832A|nr:hypothetical protein [Mesorhizobium loti]